MVKPRQEVSGGLGIDIDSLRQGAITHEPACQKV